MKIRVLAVVVLVFLLLPQYASAEATQDESCHFTAYTYDGFNHYSLLMNNSTLIGQEFHLDCDCGIVEIYADNLMIYGGYSPAIVTLPLETSEIQLKFENTSFEYSNVTVFPSANWFEFIQGLEPGIDDPITLSASDFEQSKVMTVIISSIILWVIVTTIAWKLVNIYVDRFHIEEVV
jgi:hypothetical protein